MVFIVYQLFFALFLILLLVAPAWAGHLTIHPADPPEQPETEIARPGQLPHSRIARGTGDIASAWLAGPTDRYRHGVLGDGLEASQLVAETAGGKRMQVTLPENRVFEDLEPRLADVNGDGRDEILVVESDAGLGASLAVYGMVDGGLTKIGATPFLGTANRWLNPVGVGDFDGDGRADIALVATPHIDGRLRLYRWRGNELAMYAEYPGVSTHRIGSTELGLARVVSNRPRDRLLVPNQARSVLMLLEWTENGWREIARVDLPGALISSLAPVGKGRWRIRLDTGSDYEVRFTRQAVGPKNPL